MKIQRATQDTYTQILDKTLESVKERYVQQQQKRKKENVVTKTFFSRFRWQH